MNYSEEIQRRRRRFGYAALAILLWVSFFFAMTHIFPLPFFFGLLHPFTIIESFLVLWFEQAWIIPFLLILLSLLGWLLLRRNARAGRYILIGTQCVILAADAIITPLHLINDMGFYNYFVGRLPSTLGTIALLGLCCAIYPIAVIILTCKWKPHIK